MLIVRESACLSVEHRRQLDAEMCGGLSSLKGKGDGRIVADAKRIAYRLDPQAVVDRATKAPSERTVTCRPAPDTMVYLTALLPVGQGIGVYAALKRAADTTFDGRTRGQVMADTLVERVTGTPAEVPVPVAVNMSMTDRTLLSGHREPAVLTGYGPIPAAIGRQMVAAAANDPRSAATLRRLYRHPADGSLIAMESRSRRFPKGLAAFITLRDQTCRTPYCNAPIRHIDHARPHHDGGPTSAANGHGTCERCNHDKEAPGWQVIPESETSSGAAEFVTPTGSCYRSTAPPSPGAPVVTVARLDTRVTVNADAFGCRAA
jgi:5-methylcytosine-specific restriction endonuclease McrA